MIIRTYSGIILLCMVTALVARENNLIEDFSMLARQAHLMPTVYWDHLMEAKRPMMIRVVANNCPLCRATDTMYSNLAQHYADVLSCMDMNYRHCQALLEPYNIKSLPTFLMFDEGVLALRYHPIKSQPDLLIQSIERHFKARQSGSWVHN